MQKNTSFNCRWLLLPLLAAVALAGCSQSTSNQVASAAEQKAFAGDRSKMPASEQARIQQMQQQTAQRMQNKPAQQSPQGTAPR